MATESATLPLRPSAMESEAPAVSLTELILPFKSCIDYFECISAGSPVTEDRELLLVKLYVQMERFLTWGHNSGFTKIQAGNTPQKLEAQKIEILACLKELQQLISDATELEKKYGLEQETEASTQEQPNYIGRRRARKMKKALTPAQDPSKEWVQVPAERTKWTIGDGTKFELLIEQVTAIVNKLHGYVPIRPPNQQTVMFCKDIELLDTHSLELVRDACDGPYQEWSNKASARLEASEAETQGPKSSAKPMDTREVFDIWSTWRKPKPNTEKSSPKLDTSFPPLELPGLWGKGHIYFIYTPPCPDPLDWDVCGTGIGSNVFINDGNSFFAKSGNLLIDDKWSPSRRITDSMKLKFQPGEEEMIRRPNYDMYEGQQALLEQKTPLAHMYIYCPPCVCAVRSALQMCRETQNFTVGYLVRVDDRIDATCWTQGRHLERLRSLLDAIKILESAPYDKRRECRTDWVEFVDRVWLEQRIYARENEKLSVEDEALKRQRPGTYADAERIRRGKDLFKSLECDLDETCAFVILGDIGKYHWWMKTSPFNSGAREPRLFEIYHFSRAGGYYSKTWNQNYLGTYTPTDYHSGRDHQLLKDYKGKEVN